MIESEWKTKAHFAEFAEAVGVPTDQVALAGEIKGHIMVVYSPDRDLTQTDAVMVIFRRDEDGLLSKVSETPVPDFFDEIERELEK